MPRQTECLTRLATACGRAKGAGIITAEEGSHSGLVRLSRKQLGVQASRGFESHPLRSRRGRLVGLGRVTGNDVGGNASWVRIPPSPPPLGSPAPLTARHTVRGLV
jgi:hypothetical protein